MPTVTVGDVTLVYDDFGDSQAEPVVLIAGCGQPALAWQVGVVPALGLGRLSRRDLRQPGRRAVVVAARAVFGRRDGR